jgi:tripartite-type tricarboxylate transporter receptor subunit TctC
MTTICRQGYHEAMTRYIRDKIAISLAATALATLALCTSPAAAQNWPDRTVKIIVPFGAGSTPDIIMRLIAEQLQHKLGHIFLIENKPGASGMTGTDAVAKSAPDGSTIGISIGGPLALNAMLFGKMPYDPSKDLALITLLTSQPSVLVVNSSIKVNSVSELTARLKREHGKFNFGSIGAGSLSHLAMEAIALATGADMVHVPYPSSPAAMTAIIRGDVQIGCLPAIAAVPHVASGAVKILAVTTAKRSPNLPDVPSLKESGIDVEADAWNGLIAPAGTPEPVVAKIRHEVIEAIELKAIRDKLAAQLIEPTGSTPAEFRAKIEAEIARWGPVIKAAGIKIN